jgi:glycerol-3-phosphate acyltransferase PlsY
MSLWLISISLAYLLGSIPFGYLLVRMFLKQDIRATGSGNIGATNVARSGAKGLGLATLLLDLGKGAVAVLAAFQIARHSGIFAGQPADLGRADAFDFAMAAAIAAVVGHVFPVWLKFRGGKGVATALGVFLVLSPTLALGILVVFALVFAVTRFVSLASIVASASVPLFALRLLPGMGHVALFGFLAIPLLVIVKHHANIGRLLAGTESRFGSSSGRKAAA